MYHSSATIPFPEQERFSIFLDATQAHSSCRQLPALHCSQMNHYLSNYGPISIFILGNEFSSILQLETFRVFSKYQRASDYLEQKNQAGSIKIAVIIFAIRLAEEKELSLKIYKEIKLIKKIPTSLTRSKRSPERQFHIPAISIAQFP